MCKACTRKSGRNKISGMNSRKSKKVISAGAQVFLGIVAGRIITNQVSMLNANPTVKTGAKVLGAVIASQWVGPQMAAGIMADGLVDATQNFVPQLSSQLGIGEVGYLPATMSTSVHSVTGSNSGHSSTGGSYPNIRVD